MRIIVHPPGKPSKPADTVDVEAATEKAVSKPVATIVIPQGSGFLRRFAHALALGLLGISMTYLTLGVAYAVMDRMEGNRMSEIYEIEEEKRMEDRFTEESRRRQDAQKINSPSLQREDPYTMAAISLNFVKNLIEGSSYVKGKKDISMDAMISFAQHAPKKMLIVFFDSSTWKTFLSVCGGTEKNHVSIDDIVEKIVRDGIHRPETMEEDWVVLMKNEEPMELAQEAPTKSVTTTTTSDPIKDLVQKNEDAILNSATDGEEDEGSEYIEVVKEQWTAYNEDAGPVTITALDETFEYIINFNMLQ